MKNVNSVDRYCQVSPRKHLFCFLNHKLEDKLHHLLDQLQLNQQYGTSQVIISQKGN